MYCPQCRAEFREGFTRCSDCGIELVEVLPPVAPNSSEPAENERPDLASARYFLAWFVPMCVYLLLLFAYSFRPVLFRNIFITVLFISLHIAEVLGMFWMMYQAVRHERRVGRYALLAMVPFMFVWYSLVRVPLRKEFQSDSPFIR